MMPFSIRSLGISAALSLCLLSCSKNVQKTGDEALLAQDEQTSEVKPKPTAKPSPSPSPRVTGSPLQPTFLDTLPGTTDEVDPPAKNSAKEEDASARPRVNQLNQIDQRAYPAPRPSSVPSPKPSPRRGSERPSEGDRLAICKDLTGVPSGVRAVDESALINGKRGTWQLVDFKVTATGHLRSAPNSADVKIARSSLKGEALDEVTITPVCQNIRSIPRGEMEWKMAMPLLISSYDGAISDEVRYSERLTGQQNSEESYNRIEVKNPSVCSRLRRGSDALSACGKLDLYAENDHKVVVVKTVESKNSMGNSITVRVLGRYAWVDGEEMLRDSGSNRWSDRSDREAEIQDLGEISVQGPSNREATISSNSELADDWNDEEGYSGTELAPISSSASNSQGGDGWNDGWDEESSVSRSSSSRYRVVTLGHRPCGCRVLSKRDARKVKRQVRRAIRGASRITVRCY